MKELKFRAFHKPSKKMFDVCCLDFKNKMISSRQKVIGQGKRVYFDTVDYDFHECKLMQFTGLKDIDGKEIFELMQIDDKYIVKFKNCNYILENIEKNTIISLYSYYRSKNGQIKITKEQSKF